MAAEIDVAKQVSYALLSWPSEVVSKQVAYAELAYPKIDLAKQVAYAELAGHGPQIAKQVVYSLLRSYDPQLFSADLAGELTLQAVFTDPSARFVAEFVGEGLLGPGLSRLPPFDCQPAEETTWSVATTASTTWNNVTSQAGAWVCVEDRVETHNGVLITLSGAFLVTLAGNRIKLI